MPCVPEGEERQDERRDEHRGDKEEDRVDDMSVSDEIRRRARDDREQGTTNQEETGAWEGGDGDCSFL